MTDHLARMYQTPEWFDAAEVAENLEQVSQLRAVGIYSVAGTLGVVERLGKMPDQITDIYEFGSGFGEGLVALDMFARARGDATVQGSEHGLHPYRVAKQLTEMVLSNVQGVDMDGLGGLADRPESFDLIVANMFGPSYTSQELPGSFISLARDALRPGGAIILNSDYHTMWQVAKWGTKNLPAGSYYEIANDQLPSGFGDAQPHVIINR